MFFQPKNIESELKSLDKALEILQDRYQKKVITIEKFSEECRKIAKKREKYAKKMAKLDKKMY